MLALSSRWVHSQAMAPSNRNLVSLVVRFYKKWEFGHMYLSNGWLVNSKHCSGETHSSGQSITRNQRGSEVIWVSTCKGEIIKNNNNAERVFALRGSLSCFSWVWSRLGCLNDKIQVVAPPLLYIILIIYSEIILPCCI